MRDLIPRRDLKSGRETTTTRATRKLAVAGPNAPALIRLVRYPFALRTVRGSRQRYYQKPEPTEKVDWRAEIKAAKLERQWKSEGSPVRQRPMAFTIRPSVWKLMKKVGEKK